MSTKKALVACFPDPSGNPRPYRAIKAIKELGYEVHALCAPLKNELPELSRVFEINNFINGRDNSRLKKLWYYAYKLANNAIFVESLNKWLCGRAYGMQQYLKPLKAEAYDLLLAEDLAMLPFLLQIKQPAARLAFDAREFYPAEFENSTFFKVFLSREKWAMCRVYLPKVDVFYTVSNGLAMLYEEHFGKRREVIRSLPLSAADLKAPNQMPTWKMVHHGLANPDRQLEQMIEVMALLDKRFTLDFYLQGNQSYIASLKLLAAGNDRIQFKEPVPFKKIHEMLSQYDLGFYFLKPTGLNTLYSLPNKFFEFIQARLVLAIGPSPDMKFIVNQFDMAVVAKEFTAEAMAKALNELTEEEFLRMKAQTRIAAQELNWEKESQVLKTLLAAKSN
jgi:glycosyltransferase involved in cell wall biosynthesis